LAELGIETFRAAFGAQNSPEDVALYLAESFSPVLQAAELADPSVVYLVAELGGEPVGYAQLRDGPSPASVRASRPLEIARFYARSAWIGRGVGRALMEGVRREARGRGHDAVWLGVWEKNERAIAFYRKWGFVEVDTQPFRLGNDLQTDLVMTCAVE
jgi:GNAT superfamily N-acetyltransferase